MDLNLSSAQIEEMEACLAELAREMGTEDVLLANVSEELVASGASRGRETP